MVVSLPAAFVLVLVLAIVVFVGAEIVALDCRGGTFTHSSLTLPTDGISLVPCRNYGTEPQSVGVSRGESDASQQMAAYLFGGEAILECDDLCSIRIRCVWLNRVIVPPE